MFQLTVTEPILAACPQLHIGLIACDVVNSPSSDLLWDEINEAVVHFKSTVQLDRINKIPSIAATRSIYKALGKDPNRYRPSAEALCRRILRDMDLYRINTLVDLINLVSIKTGYSIGGFDAKKIQGNVVLGVGEAGEEFDAIGRGLLNIEGLPVYRDSVDGIGTPTSDNERTKINNETNSLLMIINDYSGADGLQGTIDFSTELLTKYCNASAIEVEIIKPFAL